MEPHLSAAGVSDPCRWCGETHGVKCPWVKALEFDPTTQVVTRVEFLIPRDWLPEREQAESDDYPKKGRVA